MTIKQVRAIHNYIMILQNHWCFYIVIYMILLVAGQNYKILPAHWLIWLGIGFLPYVFSKLKKLKVLRYLIYLLLALGIYRIPFPHIAYTIIYLVGVAYYGVTTEMYDWTKDDSSDYKPIPLVVIIIMTVVVAFVFQ